MTFRSMGVLIVFLVSLLFVVVNWGPIMTPMPISFILFTVNAPLGLFLIVGGALVFVVSSGCSGNRRQRWLTCRKQTAKREPPAPRLRRLKAPGL